MQLDTDPVASSVRDVYPYRVDLENCENEPLRHIQVVQAFACLLAVDIATLSIDHVSDNADRFLGVSWEEVMNRPLSDFFDRDLIEQIAIGLTREDGFESLNPVQTFLRIDGRRSLKNVIVHRSQSRLILEIENPTEDLQTSGYQQLLARAVARIQNINDPDRLFSKTANIIRQLTGYDRVMVYRFDRDYNGEVIAESLAEGLDPFLGLHYPHTDIPKQARELYLRNRVRLISDINEPPSRVYSSPSVRNEYLDLAMAGSRGVSPIHLEYLGYMGVNNSMSVAIVLGDKLWGLFALHHYSPKTVDYALRNLLLFLGQIFSGHLSLQAAGHYREQTLTRNLIRLALGEHISKTRDIFSGLTEGSYTLLNIFSDTAGAAIQFEGRLETKGETPPVDDILGLVSWVKDKKVDRDSLIYTSESVGREYPPFSTYCESAAGVLIMYLNPGHTDWICWFRPGLSRKITWGGKPEKEVIVSEAEGTRRLGPRRSFNRYVETVEGCSAPWQQGEIDTAYTLRITIINSMIQHYAEVKQVNERLKKAYEDLETFSYTVSHDLRAPLRAINGYAEILEEDFGSVMDEEARSLIMGIQRGVDRMNTFITDILELSRVGNGGLKITSVDVSALTREVVNELRPLYARREDVAITVNKDLPPVMADHRLLRQLYTNLFSNALKYMETSQDGTFAVAIGYHPPTDGKPVIYTVSNSGPGIEEEYRDTIFQMFSRLSSTSKTEGTGVGLAIVERIINRHDGKIWVTNDGLGVTFNFYLDPGKSTDYSVD